MLNTVTESPTRPVLRFYGGKWDIAQFIIGHFPAHTSYLEPCGGAASVLLQKPRCKIETYNDLDGHVVNFFRVLRDQSDELLRRIRLTPWSREEYQAHAELTDDPVENARRFWVGSCMSISGMPFTKSGMRIVKDPHNAPSGVQSWLYLDQSHIMQAASRFFGVQIENRDALQVIADYDSDVTLIYFDPPYVHETRSNRNMYRIEWPDEKHAEAAEALRGASGFAVVSGYACELYDRLYKDWKRVDRNAATNGSSRTESIWLSPRTVEALSAPVQALLI